MVTEDRQRQVEVEYTLRVSLCYLEVPGLKKKKKKKEIPNWLVLHLNDLKSPGRGACAVLFLLPFNCHKRPPKNSRGCFCSFNSHFFSLLLLLFFFVQRGCFVCHNKKTGFLVQAPQRYIRLVQPLCVYRAFTTTTTINKGKDLHKCAG